jgi:hypothetical protein
MLKKLSIGLAALAVGAVLAAPTAQAAVPPVKAWPKFFINAKKTGTVHEPVISVGTVTFHNTTLGNLVCNTVSTGAVHNETTEGTEKGIENTSGYMTFECKADVACKVKNTKGEEVEGIFVTAESPPVAEGTEARLTGVSSLPWIGEGIEREEGIHQLLMHDVKLWIVLPSLSVGRGPGCLGTEIQCETLEGASEKEAGYELAPIWVNGAKSGLKPSHVEIIAEEGKTEKGFPRTGRLKCAGIGDLFITATKLFHAGMKGAWELVTVE